MPRGDAQDIQRAASRERRSDTELIRACLDHDRQAWDELVRRYERLVYSVPRRLGLPQDLIDDTFQETFVVLLRQLPSLERQQALPQWLITTARRVGLRLAERSRRTISLDVDVANESVVLAAEREELRERVSRAIARLEPGCRDLLLALTRSDHASYAQIAAQLGMPLGSIGPKRARCLGRLMRLLKREGATEA
ncbi:MAG: sigma-70 family RNA polymerase sigma factor [Phycisphaerales bacterium]